MAHQRMMQFYRVLNQQISTAVWRIWILYISRKTQAYLPSLKHTDIEKNFKTICDDTSV